MVLARYRTPYEPPIHFVTSSGSPPKPADLFLSCCKRPNEDYPVKVVVLKARTPRPTDVPLAPDLQWKPTFEEKA